jgi:putative glutamine amidotransferase
LQSADNRDRIHRTTLAEGSAIARLYGLEFSVNSAHHQGLGRLGEGLRAVQRAPDNVVEAVEHNSLPIIGVQWHPERTCFARRRSDAADGAKLFAWFLSL